MLLCLCLTFVLFVLWELGDWNWKNEESAFTAVIWRRSTTLPRYEQSRKQRQQMAEEIKKELEKIAEET